MPASDIGPELRAPDAEGGGDAVSLLRGEMEEASSAPEPAEVPSLCLLLAVKSSRWAMEATAPLPPRTTVQAAMGEAKLPPSK